MPYDERLFEVAQGLIPRVPEFFQVLGPGAGDRTTAAFMAALRQEAINVFGTDFAEKRICGQCEFSVDFYFPDEGTIVEIAMGLRNSLSEYERDLFKALLAKAAGHRVDRIVFFAKPGALVRCGRPGPRAISDWLERTQSIRVELREFAPTVERILDDAAE